MTENIKAGTIFIKQKAALPEALWFATEPYSDEWRLVNSSDHSGVDRKIREAGFTFLYKGAEVSASSFAFDARRALGRAANGVLARLRSAKFNAMEIIGVSVQRFLGLTCVTVSARARHIQEGMFLSHARRAAE